MYYLLLDRFIDLNYDYYMLYDEKDKYTTYKMNIVRDIIKNKKKFHNDDHFDFKTKQINSKESELMQLLDVIMGAVGYKNRGYLYEDRCVNATLFDKPIYFSKNKIENCSMDFWHMGSLENKDLKRSSNRENYYNIKPCNNTMYSNKCANCTNHTFSINIRNKSRDKIVVISKCCSVLNKESIHLFSVSSISIIISMLVMKNE